MGQYGMAGTPGAVNLKYMPDPSREYVVNFDRLDGGLNISELDNRLKPNESPDMQNLMWVDGALGSRDGQTWLSQDASLGTAYAVYDSLFWGRAFAHIGNSIYKFDPKAAAVTLDKVTSGVDENAGTFLRYGDWLLYKNRGSYIKIAYDGATDEYSVKTIEPYVPTIQLNTNPATGAGDTYQSENRLSPQKIVKFSASAEMKTLQTYGTGSKKIFELGVTSNDRLARVTRVMVGSEELSTLKYAVSLETGEVVLETAPAQNQFVGIIYYLNASEYQLPVTNVDSIDEVIVDGRVIAPDDYRVDLAKGLVTFRFKAPPTTDPLTSNSVEIKYTKANPDAKKAIDDCNRAIVFGGNQNLCIIMAGCEAQPNAYFWNGNTSVGMDEGYFPFDSYNLGGDTEDAIVGFGKQQHMLVIFKEHGIGRTEYGTTLINDMAKITFDYDNINSRIGCDIPGSIQLIENNLVFANTQQGVFYIRDTTSAMENNIVCISDKVNGSEGSINLHQSNSRIGLLKALREAETVCSFDDDSRYWLCTGEEVYAWDYTISTYSAPSWFRFTNIKAIGFFRDEENEAYHVNALGQVTKFERTFSDYGEAIDKVYQFAVQNFGSYNFYKNVTGLILVVRSDTDSLLNIRYITDWEQRDDLTPIVAYNWRLVPRNLLYRYMNVSRYAIVAKRRPGCRNVRHFTLRLENKTAGNDMSVISGQFFYKYKGRQK